MKRLLLALAFVTGPAFAGGTAYYITSRVTISGPYDWSVLQQSTLYQNPYDIRASSSPLAGVGITGDQQFTIDGSACPGVQSCLATVSFTGDVGGDYVATIVGTSTSAGRVRGSSSGHPIKAHVAGANYALVGVDNGDATATFTLSSTGETDLVGPTFAATTWANIGTATITTDTCGDLVPTGTSCQVTVAYRRPDESSGYGYVLLQAYGNTRQQDPARVTLVLPPPAED
jgi:hypothetical protein